MNKPTRSLSTEILGNWCEPKWYFAGNWSSSSFRAPADLGSTLARGSRVSTSSRRSVLADIQRSFISLEVAMRQKAGSKLCLVGGVEIGLEARPQTLNGILCESPVRAKVYGLPLPVQVLCRFVELLAQFNTCVKGGRCLNAILVGPLLKRVISGSP